MPVGVVCSLMYQATMPRTTPAKKNWTSLKMRIRRLVVARDLILGMLRETIGTLNLTKVYRGLNEFVAWFGGVHGYEAEMLVPSTRCCFSQQKILLARGCAIVNVLCVLRMLDFMLSRIL